MLNIIRNADLGLLLFRLFIGLAMAFAHGLGKVPPPEQFVSGVAAIGFPLPVLFAWGAALSELIGGIFIAAGIFTRISALFLGFTMVIAGFVVHAADPFQVKEMSLLYLAACVLLIFTGGGKYSLDKILRKKA